MNRGREILEGARKRAKKRRRMEGEDGGGGWRRGGPWNRVGYRLVSYSILL